MVGRVGILGVDDVREDVVVCGRVRGAELPVAAVGGDDGLDVGLLVEGDLPGYAGVVFDVREMASAVEMSLRAPTALRSVAKRDESPS